MPSNTAAWITESRAYPFVVKEAPYTLPEPDEVLIRNAAVALNPLDFKIQDRDPIPTMPIQYPTVLGSDISGTIVQAGENVRDLKVGQRVMGYDLQDSVQLLTSHAHTFPLSHCVGFVIGQPKSSGYQDYTVLNTMFVTPIPDHISFEAGAVLPLACDSAAAGLFQKDHLALPLPSDKPEPNGTTLLVWGGSSSVGCSVIQLAHAAGCEVIATASPRNHNLCTSLGASMVFDYKDEAVVDKLVNVLYGKTVAGAYDAVGERSTVEACAQTLAKSQGKKMIVSVLTPPDVSFPEGVQARRCKSPCPMTNGADSGVRFDYYNVWNRGARCDSWLGSQCP